MKPLFIVGYMGCGKSSLARRLARRLGVVSADTDALVENEEGATVADIFRYEGEEHFRIKERNILERLIAEERVRIISTGGGLPMWHDNMARMNEEGITLYLRRSAAQILKRLSPYGIRRRPRLRGLQGAELEEFMRRDIEHREPIYGRARMVVDCDAMSDDEVVEEVIRRLMEAGEVQHTEPAFNNAPIGVYDSGLGGLSVWREIRRLLPEESLLYLGDGKNCPYGSRSNDEIRELADAAVTHLLDAGCKMVVVACNTATAAAIRFLRQKYPSVPIVGMEPAVKPACLTTRTGVVGVLATERSLDGELFRRTSERYGGGVEIVAQPGTGFVELVEKDLEESPEAEEVVRRALSPMLERGVDRVVLGCTHYPFLLPVIKRVAGEKQVEIIDSSPAVAKRVGDLLERFSLRAEKGHRPEYRFDTFADEAYRRRLEQKAFADNTSRHL